MAERDVRPAAPVAGAAEERERGRVPAALTLQWHITSRCDGFCRHCYQDPATPCRDTEWPAMTGTVAQMLALLREWRRRVPWRGVGGRITVTGGEPLLHDRFWDLLALLNAHRDELGFAVLTSGRLIDAGAARRLQRLGPVFVQVSLDGGPRGHDRIRGPGDFQRVSAGIAHLVRRGVPTVVAFTVHDRNVHEFPAAVRTARRLGVHRVWADRFVPLGGGAALADAVLSPLATQRFFRQMRALRGSFWRRRYGRGAVILERALQFLITGRAPYACSAGDRLLALLADGTVLPCRRLPVPLGNLAASSLEAIYNTHPLLQALRDPHRLPDTCRPCRHARECRGGLKCLAHAVTGDPFAGDPGCWLRPGAPGATRPQ